ncbi:hypothetical protein H8958_021724, partial [Nasalis larvatus]
MPQVNVIVGHRFRDTPHHAQYCSLLPAHLPCPWCDAPAGRRARRWGVLVQRGSGAGPREEGPPARRHPLHALPRSRYLPLPQHFRAGTGDIRLGLHCAVRGPHRPPGQACVLRLLAEHCSSPHPNPHGHRHGGLDHEHLLGHGHGHPCHPHRLQGAGHPTAAV